LLDTPVGCTKHNSPLSAAEESLRQSVPLAPFHPVNSCIIQRIEQAYLDGISIRPKQAMKKAVEALLCDISIFQRLAFHIRVLVCYLNLFVTICSAKFMVCETTEFLMRVAGLNYMLEMLICR
jgi:hypothetical protein